MRYDSEKKSSIVLEVNTVMIRTDTTPSEGSRYGQHFGINYTAEPRRVGYTCGMIQAPRKSSLLQRRFKHQGRVRCCKDDSSTAMIRTDTTPSEGSNTSE
jgi:hypothetical protein